MRPIIIALVTLFAAAASAAGGETPWQEVAPGVKLRLISTGQIKADGTALAGIEIDMPESTKTYWRIPGDTGLPTELDLAGSQGIAGHEILWPYPQRDQTDDYLDYVYYGPTVLPIELRTTAERPVLELAATLGVCSEICIPAQAQFSLPLVDGGADRPNGLRIRQALATAPMAWQGDPQPVGDVAFDAAAGHLEVEISDADVDPQSLIVAVDDGRPLFGTPQKSPQPNLVLLPVLGEGDLDLLGRSVQLTFMTGMGAFEVTRTISPAGD